ncbi:hypothetical protein ACFQ60_29375 [Streptomyces zhihengii]
MAGRRGVAPDTGETGPAGALPAVVAHAVPGAAVVALAAAAARVRVVIRVVVAVVRVVGIVVVVEGRVPLGRVLRPPVRVDPVLHGALACGAFHGRHGSGPLLVLDPGRRAGARAVGGDGARPCGPHVRDLSAALCALTRQGRRAACLGGADGRGQQRLPRGRELGGPRSGAVRRPCPVS